MELVHATQTCRTCGETKPLAEFDARTGRGTRSTRCKECRRTAQRERWRSLHPLTVRIPRRLGAADAFVCTRCGLLKGAAEFPPVRRGEPLLQTWCRACFAEVGAKHYAAHRDREIERLRRNVETTKAANRAAAVAYLATHPCVRCGERDCIVLEFDHLGGKRANVSGLISSGATWRRVQQEIDKCRVLCANCHRILTGQRSSIDSAPLQLRLSVPELPLIDERAVRASAELDVMRTCRKCGVEKPLGDFAFRSLRTGLRARICRGCHGQYQRDRYRRYRAKEIRRLRRGQRRRRSAVAAVKGLVWQYLLQHPCVDCGRSDPQVLDFDHVRAKKTTEVGALVRSGATWKRVAFEIAKCDVRCANCHRRKTASSLGYYRSAASPTARTAEVGQMAVG